MNEITITEIMNNSITEVMKDAKKRWVYISRNNAITTTRDNANNEQVDFGDQAIKCAICKTATVSYYQFNWSNARKHFVVDSYRCGEAVLERELSSRVMEATKYRCNELNK